MNKQFFEEMNLSFVLFLSLFSPLFIRLLSVYYPFAIPSFVYPFAIFSRFSAQGNFMFENIRQEIYAKIRARVTVYRQL